MRFVLTHDAEEFAARTERFLTERIERNVMMTVLISILAGMHASPPPLFAYGLDDQGEVRGAAFRTPPWYLLPSELDEPAADALMELWLHEDPELPGVTGQPGTAQALAAAWSRRTGRTARRRMREAMHALEEVQDPLQPAPGQLRVAREDDRELLIAWTQAFIQEANAHGAHAVAVVESRLRREGMLLWDHCGPVSMVGIAPEVAGVVRIGPVYTPPELRRRGYAGTAVAATSRRALEQGARRCLLFTDLANPTSNKIYAEIGYRRFEDWEEYAFEPATSPA